MRFYALTCRQEDDQAGAWFSGPDHNVPDDFLRWRLYDMALAIDDALYERYGRLLSNRRWRCSVLSPTPDQEKRMLGR